MNLGASALRKSRATIPLAVIMLLASSERAAAEDVSAQVPFALQNGSVVLQVRIGGKGPFNVQLSTNAEVSKISFDVLNSLHLMPNATQDPTTVNPDAMIIYRDLPNVEVGSLKLPRLAALVFNPTKISNRLGVRIDGVLGYNFLDKRVVQIDYPHKIVWFFESSPQRVTPEKRTGLDPTNSSGELPLLIDPDNPLTIVDAITIAGKRVRGLFDTGQSGTLALTPAAAKFLDMPPANPGIQPEIRNLGPVSIGTLQLGSVETSVFAKGGGLDHSLKKYGAIIGNGLLEGCVVTLDYRRKVMLIERH